MAVAESTRLNKKGGDYDATKREREAYAVKIIDGINNATPGQGTAAKDAKGRIENCKAVLDRVASCGSRAG